MTKYVVIDTNVIVSALLKINSIPDKILRMVFDKLIIPVLNDAILDEYIEVLNRKKFNFNNFVIELVIDAFRENGLFIETKTADINFVHESDRVFYEIMLAAIEEFDALLITGNIKHFPNDVRVLTPREFIDKLGQDLIFDE